MKEYFYKLVDYSFKYDLDIVTAVPDLIAANALSPIPDPSGLFSIFNTPVAQRTQGYKSTGDTFTGFYADNEIQALLTLMQTKNYGRVLDQPKLLVNDNEPGTIKQEKTIYISRSSQTSDPVSGGNSAFIQTSFTFDEFTSMYFVIS